MSAIGPLPLQPGDVLPVGEHTDEFPELDQAPVAAIEDEVLELRVVPGPRDDWFVDPDVLVRTNWRGHQPQRPGRHAADRHAAGVPLAGPSAAAARARPAAQSRCRRTVFR